MAENKKTGTNSNRPNQNIKVSKPTSNRSRRKKKHNRSPILLFVVIILAVLALLYSQFADELGLPDIFAGFKQQATTPPPIPEGDEVLVHIIDVGQGDAILVMTPDGNMLIDSGESTAREELIAYLELVNVKSFEYVVFTHPDSDHIGNADYVGRELQYQKHNHAGQSGYNQDL